MAEKQEQRATQKSDETVTEDLGGQQDLEPRDMEIRTVKGGVAGGGGGVGSGGRFSDLRLKQDIRAL
ncbi:hypothetical protein MycrhN_2539 [Mycolicibacterium rhodesiae NBB3]|uniref:Uncharacterized protein n=1 Tax=Mycolicibacterium rhodesiae (strain NBB3) TaxID=710685 RepID=G8RX77_MYCRN|nr:hypothetical protein [Mycolicibacterium rhodesiae]AEV73125.1 hypothetical protein MycrhN_2539 [Mycolicibacterium rhodesiae NBB3]